MFGAEVTPSAPAAPPWGYARTGMRSPGRNRCSHGHGRDDGDDHDDRGRDGDVRGNDGHALGVPSFSF